jgi:hypothetical protein
LAELQTIADNGHVGIEDLDKFEEFVGVLESDIFSMFLRAGGRCDRITG